MKKFFSVLILFSIIAIYIITPYWTGVVAEKQLDPFGQPLPFLMPVDHHSKRGWWSSTAQSTFELPSGLNRFSKYLKFRKPTEGSEETTFSLPRFYLVHQVDHGFLPLKPTVIDSILYYADDAMIKTGVTVEKNEKAVKLLQAHTRWQNPGNLRSQIIIPSLAWNMEDNQVYLAWQELQGVVSLKQAGEILQTDWQTPQLSLKTASYQLVGQELLVNLQWPLLEVAEVQGKLRVGNLQMENSPLPKLHLTEVTVEGNNRVANDFLNMFLQMRSQQVQIGDDDYGSASGNLELQRVHLESLRSMFYLWLEHRQQGFSRLSLNWVTLAKMIPLGLTLLNHSPKLAITQLRLDTPTGGLQGSLEVTTEPLDTNALFNPTLFLNVLNVRGEMRVSETLLAQLMKQWLKSEHSGTPAEVLIQQWVDQQLLAEVAPQVYSTQLRLEKGQLQVNGKNLPWSW